jgi:hypothetical protein
MLPFMIILRTICLALATSVALSACVPGGGESVSGADAARPAMAPGEIEVTALPPTGERADAVAALSEAAAPDAAAAPVPGEEAQVAAADAAPPVAEPPPPEVVKSPTQIACEKGGGRFVSAGTKQSFACVRPTRDAGKRCNRESDCQGLCLARSQTCSPFTPVFGCQEILNDRGLRMTQCVQ